MSIFMLIMFAAILCLSCTVVGPTVFFYPVREINRGHSGEGNREPIVARL
ncbi:MAG: hypothetical protein VX310_00685 [Gemmatimonadota bacterium]|nr:hypothetical protein [Gemmatimonadota bacterium]MEE3184266.1 hypothetical protein [Gemmatimonadota bacterium]